MKAPFYKISLFLALLWSTNILAQGTTCPTASNLSVNVGCVTEPWSNIDDGNMTWDQPCGSGSDYQDVWYKVTGTGGQIGVNIFHLNSPDLVLAVYPSCPTASNADNLAISCEYITGSTGGLDFPSVDGATYYLQLQRRNGDYNDDQNGSICVYEQVLTPCGNPTALLNDFCETPATLTKNPGGTFSATTDGTFTPDHAAVLDGYMAATGPFCGLVHNNSWYQFEATSTTETFPIIFVSCTGDGVQGHVYRITHNSDGCCETFTPVSNCIFNVDHSLNGDPGSVETITASGLIVGDMYVLMIDGYLGARCDFTIDGWGAKNVLPVELSRFMVTPFDDWNGIYWKTDSERNNSHFNVLRSYDGVEFKNIGKVDGVGNSTSANEYSFNDCEIRFGKVYYKLEQVNYDGSSTRSKVISLDRRSAEVGLVAVYPNPTESTVTIDINVASNEGGSVYIMGVNGISIFQENVDGRGIHQLTFNTADLENGIYYVRYVDCNGTSVKSFMKIK